MQSFLDFLIPTALFFFLACPFAATRAGMQTRVNDRVLQIKTFWFLFAGAFVWLLMSIAGYAKEGLIGVLIPFIIAFFIGMEAHNLNKKIKSMPKK